MHFSCSSACVLLSCISRPQRRFFVHFWLNFVLLSKLFSVHFAGSPGCFFFFSSFSCSFPWSLPEPTDAYCICTAIYALFQLFWELRTGTVANFHCLIWESKPARTYCFFGCCFIVFGEVCNDMSAGVKVRHMLQEAESEREVSSVNLNPKPPSLKILCLSWFS